LNDLPAGRSARVQNQTREVNCGPHRLSRKR